MKKIKLITSLTALGSLAAATPVVATACSSKTIDDKLTITVDGLTNIVVGTPETWTVSVSYEGGGELGDSIKALEVSSSDEAVVKASVDGEQSDGKVKVEGQGNGGSAKITLKVTDANDHYNEKEVNVTVTKPSGDVKVTCTGGTIGTSTITTLNSGDNLPAAIVDNNTLVFGISGDKTATWKLTKGTETTPADGASWTSTTAVASNTLTFTDATKFATEGQEYTVTATYADTNVTKTFKFKTYKTPAPITLTWNISLANPTKCTWTAPNLKVLPLTGLEYATIEIGLTAASGTSGDTTQTAKYSIDYGSSTLTNTDVYIADDGKTLKITADGYAKLTTEREITIKWKPDPVEGETINSLTVKLSQNSASTVTITGANAIGASFGGLTTSITSGAQCTDFVAPSTGLKLTLSSATATANATAITTQDPQAPALAENTDYACTYTTAGEVSVAFNDAGAAKLVDSATYTITLTVGSDSPTFGFKTTTTAYAAAGSIAAGKKFGNKDNTSGSSPMALAEDTDVGSSIAQNDELTLTLNGYSARRTFGAGDVTIDDSAGGSFTSFTPSVSGQVVTIKFDSAISTAETYTITIKLLNDKYVSFGFEVSQ